MVWAQAELDWILRDVRLHCVATYPNSCPQRHHMTRLSYQVPAAQPSDYRRVSARRMSSVQSQTHLGTFEKDHLCRTSPVPQGLS